MPAEPLTRVGTALALAGFAHACVNVRLLRRPPAQCAAPRDPVSVLIPARDEAATIDACVRRAVAQGGVREVMVLDDGSTDATAELAAAAGARVVTGTPPPAGWLGKPWALEQLAAAAAPESRVLVFVDADVRLGPDAASCAVAMLHDAGVDVLSCFPRQHAGTLGEQLVQPLLQWSWLTTLPLGVAERSTRPSLTAACGQFLVIRRDALTRVGGFAAVRDQVLDDIALVRAVKSTGGRGAVTSGHTLASTRMYDGWQELRDGYGKSLWAAFGSPAGAAAVLAGLAVVYVVPAVAVARGSTVGALGYAAGVGSRIVAARATGGRTLPDALAHPVSIAAFAALTVRSFREHRRGRLRWKGRPIP